MCCYIHRVLRSHQPTPLRTSKPDPVPPATANLTVPPKKKVLCMYMLEIVPEYMQVIHGPHNSIQM